MALLAVGKIMGEHRRVVATGTGVVTCLGCDVETVWQNLLAGKSGIGPISKFDATDFRCRIAGEVQGFEITDHLDPKEARRLDPFCHYAVGAADQAVAQAGLTDGGIDPARAGILVGSGIGGVMTFQKQCSILLERGPSKNSPLTVPMMIADMASGFLSIRYGFQGPNMAIVTACATGTHSIGEAMWMILRGDADVMVAGGTEACIVPLGLTGFCAMKALSTRNDDPTHASRPFDAERDGFVPSEGAGVVVLESLEHATKRGAPILAELTGYGLSGDAYHITAPDPDGKGATAAIRQALAHAQTGPEEIDYVNTHGTSTPLNDKTETRSLKDALGSHACNTPMSSTKSMIGHTLGAAGGIESVCCIRSLQDGVVHGTMNYEHPDPECDLDYIPNEARRIDHKTALSVNLGFGGHNAALVFKKWE